MAKFGRFTGRISNLIEQFKHSQTNWLVFVGMVSEGTNIPRLQVCCHLSRVKTELHFRQVLGRILRLRGLGDHHGHMFILADEDLVKFAYRVEQDLPEDIVITRSSEAEDAIEERPFPFVEPSTGGIPLTLTLAYPANDEDLSPIEPHHHGSSDQNSVSEVLRPTVSIFGQFLEELINLRLSTSR